MTDSASSISVDPWVAVIRITSELVAWEATISSFAQACDRVVVISPHELSSEAERLCEPYGNVSVVSTAISATLGALCHECQACVVVHKPVVVPPDAFVRARQMVSEDVRIATVSFFSNDGDYLSLPDRNTAQLLLPPGHTEVTVTRSLRSEPMLESPVPIPVPAGPVIVMTSTALRSLGSVMPSPPAPSDPEFSIIEFALRAVRRCLRHVLDPSTMVVRVPEVSPFGSILRDPAARAPLATAHPFFPANYEDAAGRDDSPVAGAVALARTAMQGLSVLIDATAIGPFEMGTQVQMLNLIQALSRHEKVRKVIVGMVGPVPPYATRYLDSPKIKIAASIGGDFQVQERVDVLHRPCQTDGVIPWERWRAISDRIVVTIQDLIAYNNGSYFPDVEHWRRYRSYIAEAATAADGLAVVSDDVARDIIAERLPVPPDRIRVLWNGVDHQLGSFHPGSPPSALVTHGFVASEFLFVLGASYSHKNRDLAIAAWQELNSRGLQTRLVMAGVTVPYGSTRGPEARAQAVLPEALRQDLLLLPDVTPEERIWLLTHASLVLYPTSAEGFGLVPFEAAQCNTPTLFVSFGPLSELLSAVPVSAADWSPESLADAAEQLLRDPALSRSQIEAVRSAATKYTWDSTADQAVHFYRELLARPAIGRIPPR